jgi:hypothetical protein
MIQCETAVRLGEIPQASSGDNDGPMNHRIGAGGVNYSPGAWIDLREFSPPEYPQHTVPGDDVVIAGLAGRRGGQYADYLSGRRVDLSQVGPAGVEQPCATIAERQDSRPPCRGDVHS